MDKSRNQIGLPFHGAKRVLANVLASESLLSVVRCIKFVIVRVSTRTSRIGKFRLHSFSKVKRSDEWREFRWEKTHYVRLRR